jgi:multiple sugar transport system substrate-binding protein
MLYRRHESGLQEDTIMAHSHEEELARELLRRGYTRRQFLSVGLKLGLSATSLGALLAACGEAAQAPSQSGGAATNSGSATNSSNASASTNTNTGGGQAAATSAPASGAAEQATTAPASGFTNLYDKAQGADGPWPKTVVPEPTSKVELSVAHAWDATFFERQKQFDELFMERHPNIVIKAENTPWGDFRQKYLAQAAGGALPDVFYIHFSWAQDLIKSGTLIPLDDYIAKQPDFNIDDFTPPSLISYKRDGKLWVIPYDEGPGILYYNKDIFDKAGVKYPDDSWTMDTFKEAVAKLTSGDGQDKVFGYGATPTPGDALMAPSYLFPFGGQYLSEPKEDQYLLNKPESEQAMEWWMELRSKLNAVPSPAESQTFTQANIDAFQVGRVAMKLDGSWATPGINQNAKFKWDVAKWPKGPVKQATFSAGSGYGIAKTSQKADAAWIYLNEYISPAGESYMWGFTGRGSPARKSAWDAYFKSKFAPPSAKIILESLNTFASHDILDQPTAPLVVQAATPIWDLVVAGQLSVKDAIDQVGQAIEPIIAQNRA